MSLKHGHPSKAFKCYKSSTTHKVDLFLGIVVYGEDLKVACWNYGVGGDNLIYCKLWLSAVRLDWWWNDAGGGAFVVVGVIRTGREVEEGALHGDEWETGIACVKKMIMVDTMRYSFLTV
jgi:hypothetical protein